MFYYNSWVHNIYLRNENRSKMLVFIALRREQFDYPFNMVELKFFLTHSTTKNVKLLTYAYFCTTDWWESLNKVVNGFILERNFHQEFTRNNFINKSPLRSQKDLCWKSILTYHIFYRTFYFSKQNDYFSRPACLFTLRCSMV